MLQLRTSKLKALEGTGEIVLKGSMWVTGRGLFLDTDECDVRLTSCDVWYPERRSILGGVGTGISLCGWLSVALNFSNEI